MERRKIYLSNPILCLAEYIRCEDDWDRYNCWMDPETQMGYNLRKVITCEEYTRESIRSRFISTIIRCKDNARIGAIFVSPENTLPDLAIMIFKPYRRQGYGTMAFSLGVRYCFEKLKLDRIYAGCYPGNVLSMQMLKTCGFEPHPEGNVKERHYLTGEEITQLDFVKWNPEKCEVE